MAGIGLRYLQMARVLHEQGYQVTVLSTGGVRDLPDFPVPAHTVEADGYDALSGCDVVVVQGGAVDSWLRSGKWDKPLVVDLYDPWLVENFSYYDTLGSEPFGRDLQSWNLHLGRGDYFICSCEEQRLFYLGFLTALGRVDPKTFQLDPDFRSLIDVVPFSLPTSVPDHSAVVEREEGKFEILFGCVYDWYDPFTLLQALEGLAPNSWRLHLLKNANPQTTPQSVLSRVKEICQQKGWWGEQVLLHDWFPYSQRFDLVRDMDVLVAPHLDGLETRLALRTRYLEALLVGCPVVTTQGGALSIQLAECGAGWLVPPGQPEGLKIALEQVIAGGPDVTDRVNKGRSLAERYQGQTSYQPLLRFLDAPRSSKTRQTPTKDWFRRLVGKVR
jgi:glycosyltransferase involved in cell wall biosynthesis